jgi:hypothetical protein
MSLAAVLQHVQVLESSGLVRTQKTGRTRTCSLNPATLRSAERWISERRTFVERAYLDGFDGPEAPRLREGGTAEMLDGLAKYLS